MRVYRTILVAMAVLAMSGCGWMLCGHAIGQHPSTGAESLKRQRDAVENRRAYLGVVSGCLRCHGSGPLNTTLNNSSDSWVLHNEATTWEKQDKHRQAYLVLFSERSIQMGKILGTEVHRDRRCLACHSSVPHYELTGDFAQNNTMQSKLEAGVNCEGCHGSADAGADNLGWLADHQKEMLDVSNSDAWRYLDPQVKETEYGYWNVRSHVTRAQICASCHIGDLEQRRVLTHEMYAAGHPPLSGFELTTFVEQMPPHWRDFAAKPKTVKEPFLAIMENKKEDSEAIRSLLTDYQPGQLVKTKAMLIGALVSLAEHLRLTVQLIEAPTQDDGRPAWPELAQFECSACHHDLRQPSWRQSRSRAAVAPGRPRMGGWTVPLARLAITFAEQADEDEQLENVLRAVQAKPFGDADQLKTAATNASLWLTAVADQLEQRSLTAAAGIRIRRDLVRLALRDDVDFAAGRQLRWAFKVVDSEIADSVPQLRQIRSDYSDESNAIFQLRPNASSEVVEPSSKQQAITTFDVVDRYRLWKEYTPDATRSYFEEIEQYLGDE